MFTLNYFWAQSVEPLMWSRTVKQSNPVDLAARNVQCDGTNRDKRTKSAYNQLISIWVKNNHMRKEMRLKHNLIILIVIPMRIHYREEKNASLLMEVFIVFKLSFDIFVRQRNFISISSWPFNLSPRILMECAIAWANTKFLYKFAAEQTKNLSRRILLISIPCWVNRFYISCSTNFLVVLLLYFYKVTHFSNLSIVLRFQVILFETANFVLKKYFDEIHRKHYINHLNYTINKGFSTIRKDETIIRFNSDQVSTTRATWNKNMHLSRGIYLKQHCWRTNRLILVGHLFGKFKLLFFIHFNFFNSLFVPRPTFRTTIAFPFSGDHYNN